MSWDGNGNGDANVYESASATTERFDQIVFRWDSRNAADNGGYGPAVYSCDPQEARAIHEEIRTALRPDEAQPRSSLGRLSLPDGRALAFRRTPGRDASGRSAPVCHAIVGDGALLSPTCCLALRFWPWPSGRATADLFGQALEPIDAEVVIGKAGTEHSRLVRELHNHPAQLEFTALIAAALEYPRSRLLVLERGLTAETTALAYGFAELFGRFYPEGWNFSSYETRDSGMYQLAFTPAWPQAATQAVDLVRVDLRSDDGDRRIVRVAKQLTALHVVQHHDERGYLALAQAAEGTGFPDVNLLERILSGLQGHAQPRAARKSSGPAATSSARMTTTPTDTRAPGMPVEFPVPEVSGRRMSGSKARSFTAPSPSGPPEAPSAHSEWRGSPEWREPPEWKESADRAECTERMEPRRASAELIRLQQTYPRSVFPLIAAVLRAYRSVRRGQPQLSENDLQFFLRSGGARPTSVEQTLACYDDLGLLELIDWNDPQPAVHVILERISANQPQRTVQGRTKLALDVLDLLASLGDAPEHSYELRLDLAEALFNVAVRPDAHSGQVRARLNDIVADQWTTAGFSGDLMHRIVREDKPLGIPEQVYRTILRLQTEERYDPGTRVPATAGPSEPPTTRLTVTFVATWVGLAALAIAIGMFLRR